MLPRRHRKAFGCFSSIFSQAPVRASFVSLRSMSGEGEATWKLNICRRHMAVCLLCPGLWVLPSLVRH